MKGAIIGDIVGSTREFAHKVNTKEFELFPEGSTFTDDTVLTIAVYDSFKNNIPYEQSFMKWIEKYSGWGRICQGWIFGVLFLLNDILRGKLKNCRKSNLMHF